MTIRTQSTLILTLSVLLLVGAACAKKATVSTNQVVTNTTINTSVSRNSTTTNASASTNQSSSVVWENTGSGWRAFGTPPSCPSPLVLQPPVDLSLATSVLYPGQTRGGNYKPHGGFRFDNSANSAVTVRTPLDALVTSASRYIEGGEIQYLFTFTAPCGIMYRFDHLLTLSPAMQAIADTLPEAKANDSRTTTISPPVAILAGDVIATAVGFSQTQNVSVDFGVYDLRAKNIASANTSWAAAHDPELAQHAVCWFDLLSATDETRVRSLPAGDSTSGSTSDYCT